MLLEYTILLKILCIVVVGDFCTIVIDKSYIRTVAREIQAAASAVARQAAISALV